MVKNIKKNGKIYCNDNFRLYRNFKMVANVNRPVEIKSKTTHFHLEHIYVICILIYGEMRFKILGFKWILKLTDVFNSWAALCNQRTTCCSHRCRAQVKKRKDKTWHTDSISHI